jgi:adenylate cyclase
MGVLPLRAHSLRAAEADLPLDIATAIGAALARFSDFSVAPTDRLAQFGDRDETTLRQVFGLDLLLDGSVRRADSELQLDLRLLDLRAGNQVIWTHRFKAPLGESPLPHQELAAEIAAQIDPEILRIEGQRAAERTDGCGYDLVMRAIPLIARLHREEFCRAGAMLSEAIVADPTYGPARAWRAYWTKFAVSQQWIEDVEAAVDEAQLHAEQAILLDSRNARSLALASYALGYLTRRFPEARAVQARALELNPNLAMGWGLAALTSTSAGAFGDATAQFEQYRRLAPQDPNSFLYDAGMALHALLRGDTAEAVVLGRRACELNPQFTTALKIYLSALGHAGHIAEAEPVLARLRAIQPGFDIRTALYRSSLARPEDRELFTAGLVRACGW